MARDLLPQRKRLRLEKFDYSNPNYVYFLTCCARKQGNPFTRELLAEEIIESLMFLREKTISLYCYCLMPDHLHFVLSPSLKSGDISRIIKEFKSYTTRLSWRHGISGKLWQKSFYDHIARKNEDLRKICEYILANPIRKGLVGAAQDWKYSGLIDPLPF